jgi:hypothetical protein
MSIPPVIPIKRRVHRKRRAGAAQPAPPAALTLAAATYDPDGPTVDLQFDRAISIGGLNAGAIVVDDGETYAQKMGGTTGATLVNPTTVRVPLTPVGDSGTSQVLLSATGASGIVASDDGGTWAGVTDQVLPFS